MELRQLQMFLAIADCGTFTQAARQLFISQPTLSIQIAALEKELNIKLFERQGRTLALTEAGKTLRRYAVDILALKDQAIKEISRHKTTVAGTIEIYASTVPADYILPQLISRFLNEHPQAYIKLRRSDSDAVWEKITAYEADFGIVGTPRDQPSVECTPFQDDEVVVVAPGSGKYSLWPASLDIATLMGQPLVLRTLGSGTQKTFDDALAKNNIPAAKLNVRTRLESMEALKTAVLAGVGLGIASRLAVTKETEAGLLKAFSVNGLDLHRKFYLIKQKQKVLSPITETFFYYVLSNRQGA